MQLLKRTFYISYKYLTTELSKFINRTDTAKQKTFTGFLITNVLMTYELLDVWGLMADRTLLLDSFPKWSTCGLLGFQFSSGNF